MPRTLLLCTLLTGAACAADDEARFKPKAYTGASLQDRAYQSAAYAPAPPSRPIGEPLAASPRGFWSLFKPARRGEPGQRLPDAARASGERYVQREQISVPTLSPDPSAVPEKRPFDDAGKRIDAAAYQAPDKPAEKNPLLKPRQSIRESE